MTIQIDCLDPEPMCLEDAMAYEFFIEHVSNFFYKEQSGEEFVQTIAALARSSYLIAEIFSEARQLHIQKQTEKTNDIGA